MCMQPEGHCFLTHVLPGVGSFLVRNFSAPIPLVRYHRLLWARGFSEDPSTDSDSAGLLGAPEGCWKTRLRGITECEQDSILESPASSAWLFWSSLTP